MRSEEGLKGLGPGWLALQQALSVQLRLEGAMAWTRPPRERLPFHCCRDA